MRDLRDSTDIGSALDAIANAMQKDPKMGRRRLLERSLRSQHREVRLRAAEAFGILLAGGVAPRSLIRVLQHDPDELVRTEAAESLGAIGDKRAKHALEHAVNDRSPLVRAYAASAMARIRGHINMSALRKRVAIERNPQVRASLFEALYAAGDLSFLPRLFRLLNHANYRVRCAAANAIGAMALTDEDRAEAIRRLHDAATGEYTVAASSSIAAAVRSLRISRSKRRN